MVSDHDCGLGICQLELKNKSCLSFEFQKSFFNFATLVIDWIGSVADQPYNPVQ